MPNADEILVVTATLGDSCGHLSRSLTELRAFTKLKFSQLVSDDGTADESVKYRQRQVCVAHGAIWTENPGPVFGISYNLNWLFEQAERRGYEWAFLVEDSVRPGWGWLETALDALEKVGGAKDQVGRKIWGPHGRPVGAIGMTSSYEAWHMAAARALPSDLGLEYFFDCNQKGHFQACYDAFWGSAAHAHWNDGLWCWRRMQPEVLKSCQSPASEAWPGVVKETWRAPILRHDTGQMEWQHCQGAWGYQSMSGWPVTRGASVAPLGPSAWGLYNLKAWRDAGRFRDGCTFYEGHLGVRLARAGYLSVNCECPPWLHWSGLAFRQVGAGRTPRHHEPCDGPRGVLERDFGVNGKDHADLDRLARSYFREGELEAINRELAAVKLFAVPEWGEWL